MIQAAQYSTKGHPADIATSDDRIPLAISLALTESDCDLIYKPINQTKPIIYWHSTVLTCAHDAMSTDNTPPEATASIILTAIMEGMA